MLKNKTEKTLANVRIGQKAVIQAIQCLNKTCRHKLLVMGLIPGTEITVKRVAPLGDPIEISIRGYTLSLRKKEAEALLVK
ncbi:MAG: ferrous iron transport protein A [Gammaproteobacteria bacterium]